MGFPNPRLRISWVSGRPKTYLLPKMSEQDARDTARMFSLSPTVERVDLIAQPGAAPITHRFGRIVPTDGDLPADIIRLEGHPVGRSFAEDAQVRALLLEDKTVFITGRGVEFEATLSGDKVIYAPVPVLPSSVDEPGIIDADPDAE